MSDNTISSGVAEDDRITVRLPSGMRRRLEALAAPEERNLSKQVIYMLKRYMESMEGDNVDETAA